MRCRRLNSGPQRARQTQFVQVNPPYPATRPLRLYYWPIHNAWEKWGSREPGGFPFSSSVCKLRAAPRLWGRQRVTDRAPFPDVPAGRNEARGAQVRRAAGSASSHSVPVCTGESGRSRAAASSPGAPRVCAAPRTRNGPRKHIFSSKVPPTAWREAGDPGSFLVLSLGSQPRPGPGQSGAAVQPAPTPPRVLRALRPGLQLGVKGPPTRVGPQGGRLHAAPTPQLCTAARYPAAWPRGGAGTTPPPGPVLPGAPPPALAAGVFLRLCSPTLFFFFFHFSFR